jgi:hypothetical protein
MPAAHVLFTKAPHAEPPRDCQAKGGCQTMASHHVVVTVGGARWYKVLCEVHLQAVRDAAAAGLIVAPRPAAPPPSSLGQLRPSPPPAVAAPTPAPAPAAHLCHARNCEQPVPPRMLMCARHWRMVPKELQTAVWREYRPGQEISKTPTAAYLAVMVEAIAAVAHAEAGRKRIVFPVPINAPSGFCDACRAPILWINTRHGRLMPVEADPARRGESHFAYCPEAARFRGRTP